MRPALRAAPTQTLPANTNGDQPELDELEAQPVEGEYEEAETEETPVAPRQPKPRAKLPLPKYLADLDVNGSNGTPFKQFAEEKAPKSQTKRYLLAAIWLRDNGISPTINTDKVYTLFRTASWPVGISDWDAAFRQAVKRDLMRRVNPGEYSITPIGEEQLKKAED